ncbi:hypothetical protein [uncultured Nitratireductor sp.]|uniref:hypothetical protein n=1 Tax=uncultured Nitratireductor sp. TaxID=520953 RepID=UPI0026091D8A|nr:hypothetical protein [uncultured Nitratireductor sp.]
MTNRLEIQVLWSVVFATLSATIGYVLAGYGPLWLGSENAVSAAGMIAAVSGIILGLTCLFAPRPPRRAPGRLILLFTLHGTSRQREKPR